MKLDRNGLIPNVPLPTNHNTQSLCLAECQSLINDQTVKKIGLIFPNLKVLDLSRCWWVTTTGIDAILESCKHIRELILIGFQCTKLFKASNSSILVNLEVLNLSLSRINDAGLAAIAKKCPRLLSLSVHRCTNVRTKGIKQVVQNIKTLTSLSLMYLIHRQDYGALLEWMLSTGNLASLNKIFFPSKEFTEEQREIFLQHGCLLLEERAYDY